MTTIIKRLCLLCLLAGQILFYADAQRSGIGHIQIGAGYKLFPGMSNISGWNYSLGGRYFVTEKYYATALLHTSFNQGHHRQTYGDGIRLIHSEKGAFVGIGPGMYFMETSRLSFYGQIIAGYSWMEMYGNLQPEQTFSEQIYEERRGLASAIMAGVETGSTYIWGANIGLYYMGRRLRPALNITFGFYFDL